ncbi:MAG TPA: DUF6624 domain-containing protein [Streptosporangiaceae bacterium]
MSADLRAELLRRAALDQDARRQAERDWEPVAAVDADNLPWLKQVIAESGWPGRSLVGEDGAHAAWLLAQHADRDPAFQRTCLTLMTEAAGRGEASGTELAYLTDRVLLAEDQPQEYGTQLAGRDGRWQPRKLRDPDAVDRRRASVGLGPIADYTASMTEHLGAPKPTEITCVDCGAAIETWLPDPGEQQDITCGSCGWTTTVWIGEPADPPGPGGAAPGS